MIVNNLRFIILCTVLVFLQFTINNFTIFYVDVIAILLVSLLLRGNLIWLQLIILSFIGDLIGHWYLGSHLLAVVIISFFTGKVANFYRMCGWFPRMIISMFYFALFFFVIYLIELSTHRVFTSVDSLIFQLLVILPLVQFVLEKLTVRKPSEYYF
ncbi:hypothetical protein CUN60_04235 [Aquella oligotrophica]|uniref:Rod shape-determining protein MreD n=1 Tax=Aquella oligotrophica TaxID=2067065 RepID=A0A2I7N4Y9_9NEIS|nr:hypothetical protein CUN60_04235 [Aquella oligotrophica]